MYMYIYIYVLERNSVKLKKFIQTTDTLVS
jgi:hypothetical protein